MSEEHISISQYFECPSCDHDYKCKPVFTFCQLEEIQIDVVLASRMTDIYSDSKVFANDHPSEAEYSDVDWHGGVVDRYQCANCGWPVQDENSQNITNPEDLFEWLIEHKENRDKGDKS